MRKVTVKASEALRRMEKMTSGNTRVSVETRYKGTGFEIEVAVMYLHGNEIAIFDGELLTLKDAGWQTVTTKERLNGILQEFGIDGGISQRDYKWYFRSNNGDTVSWDGMLKQWSIDDE